MKRILKQTFVIIITFVLVFAISIPCFADDVKTSPAGFNSWTTQEKVNYLGNTAAQIISSVTGLVSGSGGDGFKQLCLDLYASQPEAGVYSYYEYLANGLSFDDDTETWELSDDLVDFCNKLIVAYNDKVTMTYYYPVRPEKVQADWFPSKTIYNNFVKTVQDHPECYFYIEYTGTDKVMNVTVIFTEIGAAVNANNDLIYANCSLYNVDWSTDISYQRFHISPSYPNWATFNKLGGLIEITSFDDAFKNDDYVRTGTLSTATLMRSDNLPWEISQAHWLVSSHSGAINCYKSVADMKKDLSNQVVGTYTPDYTGKASNTVTQNTVNNVTNNYYGDNSGGGSGGGSSGSDNGGGGSSGGGIFDDIISGIANGVGSIIKGIFSIIKDLVDAIADAIVSITKSITDLMGLLKGDFTSFLSAVFPFMPQEFITIMVASLALCLLGVIIKIFRG